MPSLLGDLLFSFQMWKKRGSLDAGCFHRKLACQRRFLDSRDSAAGKELLEYLVNDFVTQRHQRLASINDCIA